MILPKERRSYSHTLGRCISGGSAVTDDDLRQQIRARLSEGRLPAVNGVSKSHRGTSRPCIVCRRAIDPTEVERQIEGVGVFVYAHEGLLQALPRGIGCAPGYRGSNQRAMNYLAGDPEFAEAHT
jgi:hypothetical protein